MQPLQKKISDRKRCQSKKDSHQRLFPMLREFLFCWDKSHKSFLHRSEQSAFMPPYAETHLGKTHSDVTRFLFFFSLGNPYVATMLFIWPWPITFSNLVWCVELLCFMYIWHFIIYNIIPSSSSASVASRFKAKELTSGWFSEIKLPIWHSLSVQHVLCVFIKIRLQEASQAHVGVYSFILPESHFGCNKTFWPFWPNVQKCRTLYLI